MTKPPERSPGVIVLVLVLAAPAWAFDADQTSSGALRLSGEGSYGWQFDLEDKRSVTYLEFYDVGVRFSRCLSIRSAAAILARRARSRVRAPLSKYTEPKRPLAGLTSSCLPFPRARRGRALFRAGGRGGTDLRIHRDRLDPGLLAFGGVGRVGLISDKTALFLGLPIPARLHAQHELANRGLRIPRRRGGPSPSTFREGYRATVPISEILLAGPRGFLRGRRARHRHRRAGAVGLPAARVRAREIVTTGTSWIRCAQGRRLRGRALRGARRSPP